MFVRRQWKGRAAASCKPLRPLLDNVLRSLQPIGARARPSKATRVPSITACLPLARRSGPAGCAELESGRIEPGSPPSRTLLRRHAILGFASSPCDRLQNHLADQGTAAPLADKFDQRQCLSKRRRPARAPRLERVAGIEPAFQAWEAGALPLHHTRNSSGLTAPTRRAQGLVAPLRLKLRQRCGRPVALQIVCAVETSQTHGLGHGARLPAPRIAARPLRKRWGARPPGSVDLSRQPCRTITM